MVNGKRVFAPPRFRFSLFRRMGDALASRDRLLERRRREGGKKEGKDKGGEKLKNDGRLEKGRKQVRRSGEAGIKGKFLLSILPRSHFTSSSVPGCLYRGRPRAYNVT